MIKTHSALTMLCIITGIVMIILLNAISNGMDTEFDNRMALEIETDPVVPVRAVTMGFWYFITGIVFGISGL